MSHKFDIEAEPHAIEILQDRRDRITDEIKELLNEHSVSINSLDKLKEELQRVCISLDNFTVT